MSKHGGDQPGATLPPEPALNGLKPAREGSEILAPEIVDRAAKRQQRANDDERRRVALEILRSQTWFSPQPVVLNGAVGSPELFTQAGGRLELAEPVKTRVDHALAEADELIAKTGGHRFNPGGES